MPVDMTSPGPKMPPPRGLAATDEAGVGVEIGQRTAIYVYETPVRIWHWVNALCILVLIVTGYFIGQPLPSMPGEASDQFLMGYVRFAHFAAGQVLVVAYLCRLAWAFVGNRHSRQIFYVPFWSGQFWREVWWEAKWYLFLVPEPKKYEGHNPLAHLAMFTMFHLTLLALMLTGCALYAEGQGHGSLWYAAFGWVIDLIGPNTMVVHTVHRLAMWVMLVFAIIHIYAAIREDIMSRQSMISTMLSGERMFKDDGQ